MSRKIFITGGSGFVGTALSAALKNADFDIWAPAIDLTLESSLREVTNRGPWDVVVHLAGMSDAATCKSQPEKAYAVNVALTGQVMDALVQQDKMPHFIFAGSAMVYRPENHPLSEDDKIEPQNAYAETKYTAELLVKEYSMKYQLPATVLRLFNHTHFSQDPRFFLPFVYQQLLEIRKTNSRGKIAVGNTKVRRDLGTAQDLMKMFLKLISSEAKGFDVLNVCSGQARSLDALAEELARQMGVECEFVIDSAKLRMDHEYIVGSCSKIERRLGWKPEVLSDFQFIQRFLEKI